MGDLSKYKNTDGTYTSPKNGRVFKTLKSFRAHWYFKAPENRATPVFEYRVCQYCDIQMTTGNINKHTASCYLNPVNIRYCENCNKPIKNYKYSKGTCSRACANTVFRSGTDHGNHKAHRYRTICFSQHEKCCVVCGEDKIVSVHHYDNDHNNNDPLNLIPMCPTHHQYMHSVYADEIRDIVDEYIKQSGYSAT